TLLYVTKCFARQNRARIKHLRRTSPIALYKYGLSPTPSHLVFALGHTPSQRCLLLWIQSGCGVKISLRAEAVSGRAEGDRGAWAVDTGGGNSGGAATAGWQHEAKA